MSARLIVAVVTAVAAMAPLAPASAADQPKRIQLPPSSPVVPQIFQVHDLDALPEHFTITARQAIAIANRDSRIRGVLAKHPAAEPLAHLSALRLAPGSFYHWDIQYRLRGKPIAEAEVGPTGVLYEVTTGIDVGWPLLKGYPGVLGRALNRPYIWLPLCLLFLLPFFDLRRPFRLLHLDLLVLLAFGVSQFYFNRGRPDISVPLVYPVLAYVAVRLLAIALRPRQRTGSLVPHLPTWALGGLLALLVAARIAFGIAGSGTFDISYAGVVGADRITHGEELYTENEFHPDTYGPVNYLAYVPFEAVFPYKPGDQKLTAAIAATLTFDLLVIIGLFVLGRRMIPGAAGTRLGLAFAVGWAAFPYTTLLIASNTNDALVPLFVIWALVGLSSPIARGAALSLGTMAKFAPALLLPAFARSLGPMRLRAVLLYSAVMIAVAALVLVPVLPDGGLREFWNTTLGFQLGRTSPLSLWQREPSLQWLQTVLKAALAAVAIAAAFVPRRRTVGQVAAISGALLAGSQLIANYWIYFYAAWLVPFVVIAAAVEYRTGQASATSSFVKPVRMSQPSSVTATRSSMRTPRLPGR